MSLWYTFYGSVCTDFNWMYNEWWWNAKKVYTYAMNYTWNLMYKNFFNIFNQGLYNEEYNKKLTTCWIFVDVHVYVWHTYICFIIYSYYINHKGWVHLVVIFLLHKIPYIILSFTSLQSFNNMYILYWRVVWRVLPYDWWVLLCRKIMNKITKKVVLDL